MARLLTSEQDAFLKANIKGVDSKTLTDLINRKFDLSLTSTQIRTYKKNHNLLSGLTGRFEKGSIPPNKGKKYPGKTNTTSFKKGQVCHNKLPIGTELMKADGYVWIKIAEPNKWRQKHVLIWEAANGKRPLGHAIIFADQDRLNSDLNNLVLVSCEELLILNKKRLLFADEQLSRSGVLVSKVLAKTRKRGSNKRGVK